MMQAVFINVVLHVAFFVLMYEGECVFVTICSIERNIVHVYLFTHATHLLIKTIFILFVFLYNLVQMFI